MNFPDSPRAVYDTNPLVEVVCQIRFPQQLALIEQVPVDFQKLIGNNYPGATTRNVVQIQLASQNSEKTNTRNSRMFDFASYDENYKISLASDFIAISTTNYRRWEEFIAHVKTGIDALKKCYDIPYFTRIGLRYVNIVDREEIKLTNVPWANLLCGSAVGLISENIMPIGDIAEHTSKIVLKLNKGNVALRYGLFFTEPRNEDHFLIDADFYTDTKIEGEDQCMGTLSEFNSSARNAFRWFISDKTHEALGPREP